MSGERNNQYASDLHRSSFRSCNPPSANLSLTQKAVKAKIEAAQPQNKDSAATKKQQEIKLELAAIREKQSVHKNARTDTHDKIKALEEQFKARAADLRTARGRMPFKNVEELDQEVKRLTKQVDNGNMGRVEEVKALEQAASLKAKRKNFAGFSEAQKGIEELKAQISELRKTLDIPEVKALSQKYDELHKELNTMKAEQDKAYGNLTALRKERTTLHADQQVKYAAMKEIKDNYFKASRLYREYEQEQYKLRQERAKSERDAHQKEKRRKIADQKLEEASKLAYVDEILTAEGLIRYFEPSSIETSKSLRGPSGFAAEVQRSVDESDFKGTKVYKKEDREDDYFTGTGGKKGKKGKKGGAAGSPAPSTPTEGKFYISLGIIQELAKVNVEAPTSQADVPAVVEKLKHKRDQWKKDQESKTREVGDSIPRVIFELTLLQNIEKVRKEIDRLELEANGTPNSESSTTNK